MKQKNTVLSLTAFPMMLVMILMILFASNAHAASSYRVQKNKYTQVWCTNGNDRYVKIDKTVGGKLDIRMRNKNGKQVWQENNAIKDNWRTFYCGSDVYYIDIRVNSSDTAPYRSVVAGKGSKNQLK